MPHDSITPNLLLQAYAAGVFPMADSREDDELFWVDPDERGIIPLDKFHIPKSLAKIVRQDRFTVTVDEAFQKVVQACARPARGRNTTWISERIEHLYTDLHERGFAHSVECWLEGELVGGLYGVSLGGAFFGESMFHTATGASKVALAHLVARLKAGRFILLDTQFVTDHLKQFGACELPREEYQAMLKAALMIHSANFYGLGASSDGSTVLQLITQTS
ncbi:leucyl/phenylalanyl-tRNA--protein transferase [Kordiimonas lacus]|uniref:Leucyl/phenylalanyl-tRNA--protein transferase n=1 Tax=Kordiimonas lacus TaxID=637679 RepID=A0A1G7CSX1_9PROT|nr:leucyl/phenylalanyl-tRNA--protein transferase [Kordiimonas lacus]SDE42428.1 leucyl/phenylalanyl-tRNA--protein transferase [Kordiimonas lacus]